MATVTCRTANCPNNGEPILLGITYLDEATGRTLMADAVECGVCNQQITDITDPTGPGPVMPPARRAHPGKQS
jgi:hypothetical protein